MILEEDEVGKFEAVRHKSYPGKWLLAAKPEDGSCFYLDSTTGNCRIHAEKGFEAKPWMCRVWHCSPHGVNTGIETVVRNGGWFQSPAGMELVQIQKNA